ncbi:MAG: C_GCAxxG_C_C family protein [Anaerolineae bacterium]|nr:C_GCAxxG_C_C family protein [Anaerolineae bacterium]
MTDHPAEQGRQAFQSGLYCAESVLLAIARSQGIESPLIPRIATGFCSGIANTRGMCGALSGAIMGLGLLLGRDTPAQSVEPVYAAVQQVLERFQAEFGSTGCYELCGCALGTPEGEARFVATNQGARCAAYVAAAVRLVLAIGGDGGAA